MGPQGGVHPTRNTSSAWLSGLSIWVSTGGIIRTRISDCTPCRHPDFAHSCFHTLVYLALLVLIAQRYSIVHKRSQRAEWGEAGLYLEDACAGGPQLNWGEPILVEY